MLDFKIRSDNQTGEKYIETSLNGKPLLTTPQLNKGTAFTLEERRIFNLLGKLPPRVETLEEQVDRAYLQYKGYSSPFQQNIYLNNLNDKNQVLFYKLVSEHLSEILPTIYTPIVGSAVKQYSREYRQPRGIYLSYADREYMEEILQNRSNPEIDIIVVTDGESILGIGDQGIGGIDIPVAKLMVYSLCGGINPCRTLPILLDAGTNNQELLDDPFYLGWRHPRISGAEYEQFIEQFVSTIKKLFPKVFLHWEDLGRENARHILQKYQNKLCTFNDDIQGTGVVALAALLAASKITHHPLTEQRIVVLGAGSAGTGISDQIIEALCRHGLSQTEAYRRFWLIDRQGLLLEDDPALTPAQRPYARRREEIAAWTLNKPDFISLEDVVRNVHPTVLIGSSAQPNAFTPKILENMAQFCEKPIIFPLSNPTERCEASPIDILQATKGRALIATGTPFEPVLYNNQLYTIAQCNNALSFPGIGLGILCSGAKHLSDNMLWAACEALSEQSPAFKDISAPLLPSVENAKTVAKHIAKAVARQAIKDKLTESLRDEEIDNIIDQQFWEPRYLPFRRKNDE